MSADNFGALGADFFIKTFDKSSLMSQSDLDQLTQYVQLTTTILAIGEFTPGEQQSVWMILERVDVSSAPGYTVTNNTDVTMTSGGVVTIGSLLWSNITGKPSFFSGSYNDLTDKPTIPGEVDVGDFIFSAGDASLPASSTMTLSTYRSGANQESRLTLSPTTESSLYAAGVLKLGTDYGSGYEQYWVFGANGDLTIPGDIKDSTGISVLGGGSSFSGDYNDLSNKPTIRIAVAPGSGPGGNLQADSLALAGLNPVTDIPSTWGGDLILQGGVGGSNGDLYGEVRIKSGTIGANYEWHFTTDKKIKLPAGGNIVDSTGATAFVSLATLKQVVADSTDFADFQTRIANM